MNNIFPKPEYVHEISVENDWESLVSQGMEAREQKDNSQWTLGELADRVNIVYGQDAVGKFAVNIGVNKGTLLRYRDVHRGYLGKERNPVLSFSHHLKALASDDPEAWLEKAYLGSWSVEKLGLEIDKSKGKEPSTKKPVDVCPTCGKYKISLDMICTDH